MKYFTVLGLGAPGMEELIVIALILCIYGVLFGIPLWFISKRIGFSPWLALLSLIPLAWLVYLWVIAFAKWPVDGRVVDQGSQ